jgi:diguanylate cyclase (GGDEF)-like protein
MPADFFRRNTRGIDVAGRYGGEDFVLLMPETFLPGTVQIAERLRHSFPGYCSSPGIASPG